MDLCPPVAILHRQKSTYTPVRNSEASSDRLLRRGRAVLKGPTERAEARAVIAALLGRQVRVRHDGGAVFAGLEFDEGALLASA